MEPIKKYPEPYFTPFSNTNSTTTLELNDKENIPAIENEAIKLSKEDREIIFQLAQKSYEIGTKFSGDGAEFICGKCTWLLDLSCAFSLFDHNKSVELAKEAIALAKTLDSCRLQGVMQADCSSRLAHYLPDLALEVATSIYSNKNTYDDQYKIEILSQTLLTLYICKSKSLNDVVNYLQIVIGDIPDRFKKTEALLIFATEYAKVDSMKVEPLIHEAVQLLTNLTEEDKNRCKTDLTVFQKQLPLLYALDKNKAYTVAKYIDTLCTIWEFDGNLLSQGQCFIRCAHLLGSIDPQLSLFLLKSGNECLDQAIKSQASQHYLSVLLESILALAQTEPLPALLSLANVDSILENTPNVSYKTLRSQILIDCARSMPKLDSKTFLTMYAGMLTFFMNASFFTKDEEDKIMMTLLPITINFFLSQLFNEQDDEVIKTKTAMFEQLQLMVKNTPLITRCLVAQKHAEFYASHRQEINEKHMQGTLKTSHSLFDFTQVQQSLDTIEESVSKAALMAMICVKLMK